MVAPGKMRVSDMVSARCAPDPPQSRGLPLEYDSTGDLSAPFELTKKAQRAQAQSERIRESVRCDVPRLTWEQYAAGEPCPECGRSYRDEEHARYEAEVARYRAEHGECRHSVAHALLQVLPAATAVPRAA